MPGIVKKKPRRLTGAIMMAAKPVAAAERFYSQEEKNIDSDAAYFMDENSTFFQLKGGVLQYSGLDSINSILKQFTDKNSGIVVKIFAC